MRMRRRFGQAEQFALQFFQSSLVYPDAKSPDKFKKIVGQLDYILLEGSLKAAILSSGVFSSREIEYLHENTAELCQCAEFFMNGFKLGHSALGLSFESYIAPLDPAKPFQPRTKSVVLYPESYGELYSLDSQVARCFKSCFNMTGSKDSAVTIWEVTCK